MNAWHLMLLQSRANNGVYEGDRLPMINWAWPQGTWFQKRLRDLRNQQRRTHRESPAL
jgi:hypothetical protein